MSKETEVAAAATAVAPASGSAISLVVSSAPAAEQKSCWDSFKSCFGGFIASSELVATGAIRLAKDEASSALKKAIEKDGNLNDKQKAALTSITTGALNGIAASASAQISAYAKTNFDKSDPRIKAAIAATLESGLVGAFAPELESRIKITGEEKAVGKLAMPKVPIMTGTKYEKANDKINELRKLGVTVTNLISLKNTMTVPDEVVKEIVNTAIRTSELPKPFQEALIKSGAAFKFVDGILDAHNVDVSLELEEEFAKILKAAESIKSHGTEAEIAVNIATAAVAGALSSLAESSEAASGGGAAAAAAAAGAISHTDVAVADVAVEPMGVSVVDTHA